MSADLDKARAAVEAARQVSERIDQTPSNELVPIADAEQFMRLLRMAEVKAAIADAEAGERQAEALEAILRRLDHIGINP